MGKNPNFINDPAIRVAATTIMPGFSQDKVAKTTDADKIPDLDEHVQIAGTDAVDAKGSKESATLPMASSDTHFGKPALAGHAGWCRVECEYCQSEVTDLSYVAQELVEGEKGVAKVVPLGDLNEYETKRLEEAKAQLKGETETGLAFNVYRAFLDKVWSSLPCRHWATRFASRLGRVGEAACTGLASTLHVVPF